MTTIQVDCPECQGEGFVFYLEPAGSYSSFMGNFEAEEGYCECAVCAGEGLIDVCRYCTEPLSIVNGAEICGCEDLELPRAA